MKSAIFQASPFNLSLNFQFSICNQSNFQGIFRLEFKELSKELRDPFVI